MFFSILGSLAAFIIPIMIIGSFTPDSSSNVAKMGAIFGFVSAIPLLFVFFFTRERREYTKQAQPGIRESFKAAFKNRPFIFSAGIFLLTWVSVDILQVSLLYFIKYIVVREPQSDIIMASIFVSAMLVLPFWEWASRKWNKRKAYGAGIAFWAVVQIVLITLNSATPMAFILILCVLAGIGVSAAHVLPWSIIPDAVEWDEYHTGKRHEGMFYSLVMLSNKIASSIAIPLVLLVLELTGYVPNSTVQPESAMLGIRLVIGPIPAILLVGGILFAIFYPLSREKHSQIVLELEARRKLASEETL